MRTCKPVACLIAGLLLAGCGGARMQRTPTVATPVAPRAHAATANDIVFRAMALVGTPYRQGGNTPDSGFDCSGLVDYIFADVAGIGLPRTASDISRIDASPVERDQLESGDLVFFHGHGRAVTHVGIYVGKGRFVHAPNKGGTVRLDALDAEYWRAHYSSAKRIVL